MHTMYLAVAVALITFIYLFFTSRSSSSSKQRVPISVNYHFTRKCNYECGFCFHTAKTSFKLSISEAERGLRDLRDAGMKKINFAGGEPFLYPNFLGPLLKYCKEQLQIESVSIVTNGSLVKDDFMASYGKYIDILAVSCDSFHEETNKKIGRGSGAHLKSLMKVKRLCAACGVKFKINTVVNRFNFMEDMNRDISLLDPFRWKCFQVLVIEDENDSDLALRDARKFEIDQMEFQQFCDRHNKNQCFVPESNSVMKSSYLILDEYMRFLNKGVSQPTESILDVGVSKALSQVYWDEDSFVARGGIYGWTRGPEARAQSLDW